VKWGISRRRITLLCKTGRIAGASLVGNSWIIPADAIKPTDPRIEAKKKRLAQKQPHERTAKTDE